MQPRYRLSKVLTNKVKALGFGRSNAAMVSGTYSSSSSAAGPLANGLNQPIKKLDFVSGAKAFKRSKLRHSIVNGLLKSLIIILVISLSLVAGGVILNVKYGGKALPFTYIGDMAVGGMTQREIKLALDERVASLTVVLIDGGLKREVPLKAMGVSVDTEAASKEVVSGKFNPLKFLDRRAINVKTTVEERQVAGWLKLNVDSSKTISQDASLGVVGGKLQIKPETIGYRTDPHYIAKGISGYVAKLATPKISVNTITIKPQIHAADLQDDLAHASKIASTDISLSYGSSIIKPTLAQKAEWLSFSNMPGTSDQKIDVSRSAVRSYVSGIAQKYKVDPVAELKTAAPDGSLTTTPAKNGYIIQNIDEVTDNIMNAMSNTSPQKINLVGKVIVADKPAN